MVRRETRDVRHESVPLGGHRLDQRLTVAAVSQGLPQRRDLKSEVGLLDDGVRPERGHEGGLLDQPALVLDEVDQQVERLRGERHRLPAAEQ
jgi:hypothetical protein